MSAYYPWPKTSQHPPTLQAAATHFHENGYVILTTFCTPTETRTLRSRALQIISAFHAPTASIFTTSDQTRKMDDAYFLASASKVSCFLEETQDASAARPAVNKIGHALHDLDATFSSFSRQDKVRAAARAVGARNPLLVQSMYIVKGRRVGGEVRAHRDRTFVRGGRDGGCVGFWWALEDASVENGCLWAVPGSHRDGVVGRRFVIEEGGGSVGFVGDGEGEAYAEECYVALPVREGDLVLLHGGVVHKSEENRSERSRHAYSIHVVEGGLEPDCWLQRPPELPFRPL